MDTWDFAWGLARHINSGLSCVPSKSLIQNIGFGLDSTHTKGKADRVIRQEIDFPINVNPIVIADREYDELFFSSPTPKLNLARRIIAKFKRGLKG